MICLYFNLADLKVLPGNVRHNLTSVLRNTDSLPDGTVHLEDIDTISNVRK